MRIRIYKKSWKLRSNWFYRSSSNCKLPIWTKNRRIWKLCFFNNSNSLWYRIPQRWTWFMPSRFSSSSISLPIWLHKRWKWCMRSSWYSFDSLRIRIYYWRSRWMRFDLTFITTTFSSYLSKWILKWWKWKLRCYLSYYILCIWIPQRWKWKLYSKCITTSNSLSIRIHKRWRRKLLTNLSR